MFAATHTVKKNESLWTISKKHYGTGSKWSVVYNANRDKIKDPDHIRPGQVLKIPDVKSFNTIPDGYKYWKTVRVKLTAYCPKKCCCGRFSDGKTSTGGNAWVMNGCSVAPKLIPYETLVDIPEIGIREADDTGPAMRRSHRRGVYHIDIRMKSHTKARKWGVKWKKVKLYKRI
jgi:3D (Asp-Asp-Asp) domain-containing protein